MLYITLRQMEYITAVAAADSLTEAAAHLNISQPSLSVAVTQVEQHLGQKLFLRKKGARITATEFGNSFVERAADILSQAQSLEDPRAAARHIAGRVTLGCFEDIAPLYLAPALSQLRAALPGVDVKYKIAGFSELASDMLNNTVDLAITYDLGLDASFDKQVWRDIAPSAFFARTDPMGQRPQVSLAELADCPLILFEEGLSIRHVLGLFRRIGANPRVKHRTSSIEVMRSLAAHGEGVGISYTTPPTSQSYDGQQLCNVPISDSFAAEPIILASAHDISSAIPLEKMRTALMQTKANKV
ncbi:LysR substrate-binding domain-containing protein [Cochlodiniinecator piscidefendens]|uniref:LysR substrate-binding domain-containing protein n=1 Tax=Cochlodiniinecator piscidefendens TaxID=2715756 RepID=UPI00140ACCE1|nr:LysR substrate-binding domain-containing protein [Cochlodiniinecator piscidefendens]